MFSLNIKGETQIWRLAAPSDCITLDTVLPLSVLQCSHLYYGNKCSVHLMGVERGLSRFVHVPSMDVSS